MIPPELPPSPAVFGFSEKIVVALNCLFSTLLDNKAFVWKADAFRQPAMATAIMVVEHRNNIIALKFARMWEMISSDKSRQEKKSTSNNLL